MLIRIFLTAAVILLSACEGKGLGRAFEFSPDVTSVSMPDGNYRIMEHKTENYLMVTTSIATAAAAGVVFGANVPEISNFEAAARRRLDDTGRRDCVIDTRGLVVKLQYEFGFTC